MTTMPLGGAAAPQPAPVAAGLAFPPGPSAGVPPVPGDGAAFEEMFGQLAGALLATAAGDGPKAAAPAPSGDTAATAGEPSDVGVQDGGLMMAGTALPLPLSVTEMPRPLVDVPVAGGEPATDDASAPVAAATVPSAAPSEWSAPAPRADHTGPRTSGAFERAWAPAGPLQATATGQGAGATTSRETFEAPVLPEPTSAAVAAPTRSRLPGALTGPADALPVHTQPHPPDLAPVAPPATPADAPIGPPSSGGAPSPGPAVRFEALERALQRRAEADEGATAPRGLATAAARAAAVVEAILAGTGDAAGADTGEAPGQPPSRRAARTVAGQTPPSAAPAAAAASQAPSPGAPQPAHTQTAGAAWKAAAAAAWLDEAAPRMAEARPSAVAPSVPPVMAATEPPVPRDLPVRAAEIEPAATAEAPAPESVHAQIVKSMRLQWTGGAGEARVALKPDYLGEVVASIKVEAGVVTATLQADTAEVRRLLESQTAALRDALTEHGLKLDRLVIAEPETPAGPQGDRRSRGRQPQPPPSRPRRRPAADDERTFDLTTE